MKRTSRTWKVNKQSQTIGTLRSSSLIHGWMSYQRISKANKQIKKYNLLKTKGLKKKPRQDKKTTDRKKNRANNLLNKKNRFMSWDVRSFARASRMIWKYFFSQSQSCQKNDFTLIPLTRSLSNWLPLVSGRIFFYYCRTQQTAPRIKGWA